MYDATKSVDSKAVNLAFHFNLNHLMTLRQTENTPTGEKKGK